MPYYYEVFHELNPKGVVILAFKEEQTPMRVKDKACRDGNFQWRYYTELRVRKATQHIPLEAFTEEDQNDGNKIEAK